MEFVDFRRLKRSRELDLLFPGWARKERVAFFSPHDDDVILGAGYLLRAVLDRGGMPWVFVFCRGDAGYSTIAEKDSIVGRRQKEALTAYASLGIPEDRILFHDTPDFALMSALDRRPEGSPSLFDELIRIFRRERISRVVFSSGHFEHRDHTAAYYMGVYTMPQSGDPILADLGPPREIRSYLAYSVWTDFAAPEEGEPTLRADCGILAPTGEEELIRRAIGSFGSQGRILAKTIANDRERRRFGNAYLELYQRISVRKPTDFSAYFERLRHCT
jgi:LmbE family N-acetylglucosaminyl deacetylase